MKSLMNVLLVAIVLFAGMMMTTSSTLADNPLFVDSGQELGNSEFTHNGVALGDLDQDGDLDAYVITYYTQPDQVWFNDGKGNFTDSEQKIDDGEWGSTSVSLADLDGDKDLDVFIGHNSSWTDRDVWLNNGTGIFSNTGQYLNDGDTCGATSGDIDGDGDIDVIVANPWSRHDIVFLNDGTGQFSDSGQEMSNISNCSIKLADMDNDGDLDAITVGNTDKGQGWKPDFIDYVEVWKNNGQGVFTVNQQELDLQVGKIAVGDLDGDGYTDVFASANGGLNGNGRPNTVLLNDGTGKLVDTKQRLGFSHTNDIALGDLDNDGDLDVFVTNGREQADKIWLNDGTGLFVDSELELGNSESQAVALGDLDGDGDLDAFVTNQGANKVWLNNSTLTVSGSTCDEITDGLVACYLFDGNANDGSGNENNGTLQSGVSFVDGKIGKAASFDGGDNAYIRIPHNATQKFDDQFSVTGWVSTSGNGGTIFNKYSWAAADGGGKGFGVSSSDDLFNSASGSAISAHARFNTSYIGEEQNWPVYQIPVGQFHYFAVTYNDSQIKLYVNAELKSEKTIPFATTLDNSYDMLIGAGFVDDGQTVIAKTEGLIDDLRIYNRALSEAEVNQLFQGSSICPNSTCNVAKNGSDETGDGSEAKPFATIQHGIDAAEEGYTVLVHAGTYVENVKVDVKNLTLKSADGAEKTVIDGNQKGTVLAMKDVEKAIVDGFTITNGNGQGPLGGLFYHVGPGGVSILNSNPIIKNLIVTNNVTHDGGGISCSLAATPTLINVQVTNNTSDVGGGIYIDGIGSGICHMTLKNVTVANNHAKSNNMGGGLFSHSEGTLNAINSIFWNNTPNNIHTWGTPVFSITHSDVEGGWIGESNIDTDPLFENGYHLSENSPAIGAGTSTDAPETDIEGNPRPNPPSMGAYETSNPTSTPTLHITKTASITAAQLGETVTYQIQLQSDNNQAVPATLTDTLPFGLDYVPESLIVTGLEPADGCHFENSENEIRCQGTVATTATLTYQANVTTGLGLGSILNNNVIVTWSDKWDSASASVVIQDTTFRDTLVIIYASMDNNLSEDGLRLLNNAELGAGNPYVKTLLIIDGAGKKNSFVYRLKEDKNPLCPTYDNPSCGEQYKLGEDMWEWNKPMGSPYSLADTLQAIQRAYPNAQNVKQLALALVGHGDGISYDFRLGQPAKRGGQPGGGLLIDENPHPSSLSTKELGLALAAFHAQTGDKIGLLYLDACLMGMAEVAAEIQDDVEFVLFSENIAWATFPYGAHLKSINDGMEPKDIGLAWLENEKLALAAVGNYPHTLSLIDLAKMPTVLTKINSLGQDLTARAANPTGRDQIKQIRQQTDCFDSNQNWALDDNDNYCDIVSFAEAIKADVDSSSAEVSTAQALIDAVKQAVVKESHMNGIPGDYSSNSWTWGELLGGLSIYLPIPEDNCKRRYYTPKHFRFVEETAWNTFLTAYWQGAEPPVVAECNGIITPPKPADIKLEVEANATVQLEWDAVSTQTYRIKRQNGAVWTTLAENHASGTYPDNDNSFVVGQTYCYQVETMTGTDEAEQSNIACINYGTLELWAPELNSPANETVLVSINLKNSNGLCFAAGNITLNYDSAIVRPTGKVNATAFTTGYAFVSNIEHANQVRIATMSDQCQPLNGAGQLFMVEFEVIGSEQDISPLDFVTGLTNTALYDTTDLFNPVPLALDSGSLTVQETCGPGDTSCDGVVNAADALLALRIAVASTPTSAQKAACDVTGDGKCNSADATKILCFAVTQDWNKLCPAGSRLASRQTTQPTTIGLSNFTGQAGETATMWVRLQHAPDMAGGDFSLIYDETMMNATDTALIVDGFSSAANLQEAGRIRFALASKSSINKDSELFKITFQLKKDIDSNPIIPAQVQVDLNDGSGLDFETNLQRTIEVEIYQRATVYLPVMIK
ncbi:FG-GAP-like repeat-containing protein [Anaerolineales bacterium HSG6]|nr:FG-GAP-like repeat-containing protein [Anaerolineales bacterium HSG6]